MENPSAPRMKYKVIKPEKPKRVSKGPWESRIGKRAEEAPRKSNGSGMPKRKMGHRSPQTV